jgi:hypothetical protein
MAIMEMSEMHNTLYKAVICFSIYAAAKQYHRTFIEALLDLEDANNVALLILEDGYCFSDGYMQQLKQKFDVFTGANDPKNTVQQTKILLIEQAANFNAEVIVFTDFDDYLHPQALSLHLEVLRKYDFSYSDQILIDDGGQLLGRTLFDRAEVPRRIDSYKALLYQNYCGLSALAFNKATLAKVDISLLAVNSIAPDWMLTMLALRSGAIAGQTQTPVVFYRQHQANYFNAEKQLQQYYEKKLQSLIVHLKNLDLPETREYLVDCQDALSLLTSSTDLEYLLETDISSTRFPWFQDIYRFVQSSKVHLLERGYR